MKRKRDTVVDQLPPSNQRLACKYCTFRTNDIDELDEHSSNMHQQGTIGGENVIFLAFIVTTSI